MIGQTKSYSKHQDIVDRFIEETDPYTHKAPVPFDQHGYLDYVSEHHKITFALSRGGTERQPSGLLAVGESDVEAW